MIFKALLFFSAHWKVEGTLRSFGTSPELNSTQWNSCFLSKFQLSVVTEAGIFCASMVHQGGTREGRKEKGLTNGGTYGGASLFPTRFSCCSSELNTPFAPSRQHAQPPVDIRIPTEQFSLDVTSNHTAVTKSLRITCLWIHPTPLHSQDSLPVLPLKQAGEDVSTGSFKGWVCLARETWGLLWGGLFLKSYMWENNNFWSD